MAKIENKDVVYRNAKAGEKVRKISDGKGMYLHVNTDGSKYWRLAYGFHSALFSIKNVIPFTIFPWRHWL